MQRGTTGATGVKAGHTVTEGGVDAGPRAGQTRWLTLHRSEPMDALMRAAGESSQDVFPMLDEHDGVVGTVSEQDVIRVLSPTERTFPLASRNLVRKEFVRDVEDVMTLHPSTVRSDQQTDAALRQMEALHLPQIVVDREGQANRYARNWRPKVI